VLEYGKKLAAFCPAGCTVVGRLVEQQVAALRQGRADLQPAERGPSASAMLPGRREMLDAWLPEGAEGTGLNPILPRFYGI
jgi:hypothetical protein